MSSDTKNSATHRFDHSAVSSVPFYPNASVSASTTTAAGSTNSNSHNGAGPSKRQAMKGQWQTPPVGEFFPSVAVTSAPSVNIPIGDLPVPSTSDDYARALQEAYRRGAEAAAALSQSRNVSSTAPSPSMVHAAAGSRSIPHSNTGLVAEQHVRSKSMTHAPTSAAPATNTAVTTTAAAAAASVRVPGATKLGVPTPLPFLDSNHMNADVAGAATHSSPLAAASKSSQPHPSPSTVPLASLYVSSSSSSAPPSVAKMNLEPTPVLPERVPSAAPSVHMSDSHSISKSDRSVSMPDMSRMDSRVMDDEEAKRLKRLARNRASARLRRLRKKNLVESYEAEVGVLESSLGKLKAHKWGVGGDASAVLEALSMDRGQQKIDSEKRKELITSILGQQREQVRSLMDCQLETMILGRIAQYDPNGVESNGDETAADSNMMDSKLKTEMDELSAELNQILDLTPEQKEKLRNSTKGLEDERRAIEVIDESLLALMSNSWLFNNGIEQCTDQFTEILNPTQVSKFLLWADQNSEAIDQLDYVNAPPANAAPNASPTFVFGIDEMNAGEDG